MIFARNIILDWITDHIEDIIFSFLPFSKGDTRVILVFAADICGILMYAADICGILIQLGHTEYATNIWGKHKYAANICGIHEYDSYDTSMTRVSPFENGSNEMRMSSHSGDYGHQMGGQLNYVSVSMPLFIISHPF